MINSKGWMVAHSLALDPAVVDRWLWKDGTEAMHAATPELPEPLNLSAPALATEGDAHKVEAANDLQDKLVASYWAQGRKDFESSRYAEALDNFRNILALRPAHRSSAFNVAICLGRLGRHAEAESAYRQALDGDNAQPEANLRLGWCLVRLGRDQEAEVAFEKCLDKHPSSIEAKFGKAVVFQRLGHFDDALTLYSSVPAADGRYAEALANMIAIAAARTDHAKQREYGQELLKLRRQSRAALEALMQAEMAAGDYKAAAQHGLRLVKCAANSYEAWFNLGICYHKTNRAEQAAQAYTEAIKIREDGARAHCNLGVLLQAHGDLSGARREFEKVLEIEPANPGTLWNLAIVHEREGDVAKAEKVYLRLIRDDYKVYAAAFRLGRLRMDRKNYIGAADAFERCLLAKNGDPTAEINLALAQSHSTDPASVNTSPSALLSKHPNSREGLQLRAKLAIKADDWRNASEVELRLRELGDNTALLAYNIGILQQRENLIPEAIRSYQQASDQKAGFTEALLNCGHALLESGQADQARMAWLAALDAKPELAGRYFKGALPSA